jgi:hypothetical protein
MLNSSHRIRRLRCLVSTSDQTEAFAIRQSLRDRWQDTLLPVFERAFDEVSGGDRILHIPKIELHLKVPSDREFMDVLPELVQQQLTERWQSIASEIISTTQQELAGREATIGQNQFDILLHYLQTGSLPWQSAHASVYESAVDLKETCYKARSQLVNHLHNQPEPAPFYFRLLQLLSTAEFMAIVNTLSDRFPPEWKTAISESIGFVLDTAQSHLIRHTQGQLIAAILSESLQRFPSGCLLPPQQLKLKFSKILADVLSQSGIEPNTFLAGIPAVAAVLFQPQVTPISNPSVFQSQDSELSDDNTRSPLNSDTINLLESSDELSNLEANLSDSDDNTRSPLSSDTINLLESSDELSNLEADLSDYAVTTAVEIASTDGEFPLFVNYAGLVLIHPFLSPFFEATGVKAPNSKAIADAHIPRAAALLHFLATGQEELYEYELGFIKILLGLEPDTPILVGEGLIEESDRQEAEALLQSAINYWTVLKGTSVNGFRTSFLQRSGLLRNTENGWILQVEHQAFDLLLEHLPWSISVIKLSWMKYPLYTEWQSF